MIREIIFWGDHFETFYKKQEAKVRKKIDLVLWLITHTEKVPVKFLKHLVGTDGIYEIRVQTTFKEIRILCFFDDINLIVTINCFIKKSRKTPKKEIDLGQKLRREYYDSKERRKKR